METCIKIKILIAIMQATIISYQKSTRQKYKIKNRWTYQSCMDQTRHPDARHTSDTSNSPYVVRRPNPQKKYLWVSRQKTRTRPATPKHDPAPRWRTRPLDSWYGFGTFIYNIYIYIYIYICKNYVRLHDIPYADIFGSQMRWRDREYLKILKL